MKYRLLGRSRLLVSELCLGMTIFGKADPRGTDELTAIRLMHPFLDAGGNFIDAADVHAGDRSKEITARC